MLSNKKHILVIEDDQPIRESLEELLIIEGFKVSLAEHGLTALGKLKSMEEGPTLILLDLSMPVMDGYSFLEIFKKDLPHFHAVPIIIMTAAGSQAYPKNHDPKMIFSKPIDVDALMTKIESLI